MKNNSWFNPSSNQFLNRTSKIRNLETPTRPSTPTSTKCPYLSRGSLGPIILRWRIAVYNAMKGDGLQSISWCSSRMIKECGTICKIEWEKGFFFREIAIIVKKKLLSEMQGTLKKSFSSYIFSCHNRIKMTIKKFPFPLSYM